MVYGFPVAFNPYFFIPFVIGTPLLGAVSYSIFTAGLIRNPITQVGGLPTPITQYLMTLDWKVVIYVCLLLFVATIMYYPFFKMYEKSLLEKEVYEENKKEISFDEDLDIDLDI